MSDAPPQRGGGRTAPRVVVHVDTERGWRGGERQVLLLAQALARRGVRSLVAARPDEPLALRAAACGIEVIPCAPAFEGDPAAAMGLRRALRRVHADLVHAHTGHAVMLGALATWRTGMPLVVTRRVSRALRGGPVTTWKYGRAAMTIAISRAVADTLHRAGVPAQRVTVVPSGIDLTVLPAPADASTVRACGVPPGAALVVMVAALTAEKDHATALASLPAVRERVPSVHLLIVGGGPLRTELERVARTLHVAEHVTFTGHRDDAGSLLAAARVVALTSRSEGLGSTLLEAMALGVPVVATAVGGIPEVIGDSAHVGGIAEHGAPEHGAAVADVAGALVPSGDPPALADALARVLTDDALRDRLSRAGQQRAQRFSIERTADETLAVYERVLASASR
ncbi:MAG TPA: glycosyltransferase family 4 protein [Gemmatimonadaceae bacterium]|nr:glycosyltransferase family 4 protein [Gemmatimonadaceae bacterium]